MTVKKSNIRREIDYQFEVQQQEEDIDDFENPLADAVQNLISDDIQTLNSEDIAERFSSLRTRNFNDNKVTKGKASSRNKVFKDYFNSLDESKRNNTKFDESDEEKSSDDNEGDIYDEVERNSQSYTSDDEYLSSNDGGEQEGGDDNDSSIIGSDHDNDHHLDTTIDGDTLDFLYSKQSKASENEKGKAVQHQISLWDSFLECRIRLQKAIVAFNKFPTQEVMKKYKLHDELKIEISTAEESIATLMETLISLHEKMCKQYQDAENSTSNLKRKMSSPSIERPKKRKVDEYKTLLEEMRTNFSVYEREAIQKWNDKTKVASGKMNRSNFSAFDQSILEQIDHILNDKARLVRRTQQRKSKYLKVGDTRGENQEDETDEYDVETFDDDDFYHKILRDYIEKKTVDINDPQKLGKQWMELQKLRSKMKRKIDVKSTKGRRLRYGVHEKLVNFMAPVLSHQWHPESEAELFKSLFGRKK